LRHPSQIQEFHQLKKVRIKLNKEKKKKKKKEKRKMIFILVKLTLSILIWKGNSKANSSIIIVQTLQKRTGSEMIFLLVEPKKKTKKKTFFPFFEPTPNQRIFAKFFSFSNVYG